MSYTEQNHQNFSNRQKSWMNSFQNLRQEAAKLEAIYYNEAAGGTDPLFVEVFGISKDEHVAAVVMFEAIKAFCENEPVSTADRQATMTPFLQDA